MAQLKTDEPISKSPPKKTGTVFDMGSKIGEANTKTSHIAALAPHPCLKTEN
jgi:hypothetical protein